MDLQDTKKLINNVIENEFSHIQETQEYEDSLINSELNAKNKNIEEILKKLFEVAPEHKELIDKFDSEVASYWTDVCRYYFKKGVAAGTANLNFLRDLTDGTMFY